MSPSTFLADLCWWVTNPSTRVTCPCLRARHPTSFLRYEAHVRASGPSLVATKSAVEATELRVVRANARDEGDIGQVGG